MMKRKYWPGVAALALVALSCGGDEYGGFRQALQQQRRMMDEFTVAAGEASGPEAAAAALEKFQKEALAGREGMVKLLAEHPGLAEREKADLPESIREEMLRIDEATPRFVAALFRIEEAYGQDPKVGRRLERMKDIFSLGRK